jgi:hypothetical protein
MDVPRRSEGGVALAAAPAPARAPAPRPNNGPYGNKAAGGSGETLVQEEEERTLGQLRDRLGLTPGLARVPAPGPRALFVHNVIQDNSSGENTDGQGEGGDGKEATCGEGDEEEQEEEEEEEEEEEQWEEEEEVEVEEEEEEAEPRDLREHVPSTGHKGGNEAVSPRSLPPGARSQPGSPRARLRVPRRVANNAIQDNAVQQQKEEEEAGIVPELRVHGDSGHVVSSRFEGVFWKKASNKWVAQCKRKHLGHHASEEAAARAYIKYLVGRCRLTL